MTLRLNGSTSGYVEIDAPAVAGNNTLILPTVGFGKILQVEKASDATGGSTSSTSYTGVGNAVSITMNTGTKVIVIMSLNQYANLIQGAYTYTSFAVSGASTFSASDNDAVAIRQITTAADGNLAIGVSRIAMITNLTAGSNTFTMQHRVTSGSSGTFFNRNLIVMSVGD